MEEILAWGLDVVRATQSVANPVLTAFARFLSFLGTEFVYLALLFAVYWCVDHRKGIRLCVIVIVSAVLNAWLKLLFAQPRPFQLDPSVKMAHESSHGLPSNHAQTSAVFWGTAAPWIRKPWGILLAVFLPLLIGLSRIYLGVHFPTDVFLGWVLGGGLAAVSVIWGDDLERLLERLPGRAKILLAAVAALGMNAVNMNETGLPGGLFGMVVGAVLASSRAPFDASSGTLIKKAGRFLVGIAGAAVVYLGLKAVFPRSGSPNYALFRFVRYGLLGTWVSLGAPWAFLRLGLADERPIQKS